MDNTEFIREYFRRVERVTEWMEKEPLSAAADALYTAWKANKPVLFCGNGGSGSTCSHIVNDLQKNIGLQCGKPLKALCLSDASALVSAWANDSTWENVFAPQVFCWAETGAVVVGVSGSGNSENVLQAIDAANALGCVTIGLTGFEGGKLKEMAHISLHVSLHNMQQVEDIHMMLLHLLFLLLERRVAADG